MTVPARVFLACGWFVAAYALSAWSISQGGPTLKDFLALDAGRPNISAYFAIPVIGLTITLIAWSVHRSYVSGGGVLPWLAPDKATDGDRALIMPVIAAYVAFVLLPCAALIHLNKVVWKRGVVWSDALPAGLNVPAGCMTALTAAFFCNDQERRAAVVMQNANDSAGSRDGRLWLTEKRWDPFWARGVAGPQRLERIRRCGESGLNEDETLARAALDAFLRRPGANSTERAALEGIGPLRATADIDHLLASCDGSASVIPAQIAERVRTLAGGMRDRSDRCRAEVRECRGVQWVSGSSWLVGVPTVVGLGLAAYVSILFGTWLTSILTNGGASDRSSI